MESFLIPKIQYTEFCSEKKEGETSIMRHPQQKDKELRQVMHLGCETMWDAFEYNFKVGRENNNFIGYRKRIDKNKLENKYTWIKFKEANEKICNFSKGLKLLNLCPETSLENEIISYRFLGIYSRNKPEWLLSYFGAVRDSITVVTIYDTLGDQAMKYILKQTKVKTVVVESSNLKKILELAKQNSTSEVKTLIVIEKEFEIKTCKELEEKGFQVFSFEDIVLKGQNEGQNIILNKPGPETISTVNYTSGTTGDPKGVKIMHKSIILNTDVIEMLGLFPTTNDVYLSILPYAHVMELLIMAVIVSRGVQIGIYSGDAKLLTEDAQLLHPTATCSVPRIFQRIYDGIMKNIEALPWYKKKLFKKAVEIKIKDFEQTGVIKNILLDNLVFKKIRNILGGRMRFMLVGSAPVEPYLLNFLRCTLSCEIVEGYGQTENCAGVLLKRTYDPVNGNIGGPGYSCELKLIDVPYLNYYSTDIDEETGNPRPRGELCVRGPIVFQGYLSDPEKTKEAIDSDGWLHSGDIAMVIPEEGNALKLIDRVKNMFKLSQGEYIAPEKIENILSGCKYVEQLFVYGDSLKSHLVGILVPKKSNVIEFLKSKGIEANNDNFMDFYTNKDLKKEILTEIDKYGREKGLKGFELVKNLYLSKEKFGVSNNLLTPTGKIRRHILINFFKEQLDELYNE